MYTPADPQIDLVLRLVTLGPLALAWTTLVVRLVGLRSYSKMSAVDFIVTIANGSLLANAATATDWAGFIQAAGALAVLLGVQAIYTWLRRAIPAIGVVENEPVVLMREGIFDEAAMAENRISRNDVWAKLREANALDPKDVRAVVLETTGDISVLHGARLDPAVMSGVGTSD